MPLRDRIQRRLADLSDADMVVLDQTITALFGAPPSPPPGFQLGDRACVVVPNVGVQRGRVTARYAGGRVVLLDFGGGVSRTFEISEVMKDPT